MCDPFALLRTQLLADDPSLSKYLAQKKKTTSQTPSIQVNRPQYHGNREKGPYDFFKTVDPKTINNEEEVYERRGKKYKKVDYGATNGFLVHRGLNPANRYSKEICPAELESLEKKKELSIEAREAKLNEAMKQKAALAEESEARRDSLKNKNSDKMGVVDDLVKQDRAKVKLILKNSERARVDQDEEMRGFYSHAGSTQVLAMRELQIEDRKCLKDAEDEKMQSTLPKGDELPSEYEEMTARRKEEREKNMKIVDVLKKQANEKEILKNLEIEQNFVNAGRVDALAEAELKKRMEEKENEEKLKQRHFETFNDIVAYRDYLRQVRLTEDELLQKRENEYLTQKAEFNKQFANKQNEVKAQKQRMRSLVAGDLRAEIEKRETEEMEYYYTVQKERELQMEDEEIQGKLDKKKAMSDLMAAWDEIRKENRLLKEAEERNELQERERMLKFLEMENNAKKAEERKRLVDKDVSRMEIMYQINERETERQKAAEAATREIKLLQAEQFVRDGKIKERMLERINDFQDNGLPDRFVSTIRNRYRL